MVNMLDYLKTNLFNNISLKQTFFKNSFWRFFGVLPNKVISFFIVIVAAKQLGPELFGTYSYILALVSMAFIFSDWGINILLIRDYQQTNNKEMIVSTSFIARFFILILTILVAVILLLVNKDHSLLLPGIIITLTLAIGYFKALFLTVFIAVEKAEIEAKVYLIDNILSVTLFFTIFYFKASVITFSLFYLLLNGIICFISWLYVKKLVKIGWKFFDKEFFNKLLKNGLPLSLFGILGYIFFSTDQLFLEYYKGYESVGHYALATKIILAIQIIPSLVNAVILPVLSKNIKNLDFIKKIVFKGLFFYGLVGGVISALIFYFTPFFIKFFGGTYSDSGAIIQYLSPILIFMFMVAILDHVLIAFNLQKQDFSLTMVAAVTNLILLYVMVPKIGIMGAVWSSLISQGLNLFLTLLYTLRVFRQKSYE